MDFTRVGASLLLSAFSIASSAFSITVFGNAKSGLAILLLALIDNVMIVIRIMRIVLDFMISIPLVLALL